jgi:hypothetical protein
VFLFWVLTTVLLYGAGLFAVYWVLRLAIRHALEDADIRRARTILESDEPEALDGS